MSTHRFDFMAFLVLPLFHTPSLLFSLSRVAAAQLTLSLVILGHVGTIAYSFLAPGLFLFILTCGLLLHSATSSPGAFFRSIIFYIRRWSFFDALECLCCPGPWTPTVLPSSFFFLLAADQYAFRYCYEFALFLASAVKRVSSFPVRVR